MSASSSAVPSASASLAPGSSPPLFTVTATDKSGIIVIVTAFCLSLAVVACLVRAYVRFKITAQRLAWDDAVISVAVLSYIVQAILVFYEVHDGFGKAIDDVKQSEIVDIQKFIYADGFFYILTIWLTKLSTTLLYLRLSQKRNHRFMNFGLICVIGLTLFISIMITALRCDLSQPWIYFNVNGTTCSNLTTRWQVVAAFDVLTETMLAGAAIFLFYRLQMDLSKKGAVIFAFVLRLVVVVPIALRLHYFSNAFETNDPTLRAMALTVCTQVQIGCAIVIASVPTLRPFIIATATHYGAPAEGAMSHAASGQNHTSTGASFNLKKLTSKLRNNTSSKDMQNSRTSYKSGYAKEGPSLTCNDDYQSHTNITAGRMHMQDGMARGSADSREAIIARDDDGIRKDVRYMVSYGDHN